MAALAAIVITLALHGCGQYTIVGKVIQGDVSDIAFVPADDPRLAIPGLAGAQLSILRDPETLRRALAGSSSSDDFGEFEMPVEGVGAGWMVENWLVRAERTGFAPSAAMVAIPANPKRLHLLVTMRRGAGTTSTETESLVEELERYR
jgi:hypothetical protein